MGNAQDWELLKSRRGGGGVGRDAFFDFEESKVLWKSFGFEQILCKFGFYRFWRSFEEVVILLLDEFDKEVLVPKEQGRRRN